MVSRTMSRPSIAQCSWVWASSAVRPVGSIRKPPAKSAAPRPRSRLASAPTPSPTRPAALRPKPSSTATEPSAWPGATQTGISIAGACPSGCASPSARSAGSRRADAAAIRTTSPVATPSSSAVAGETRATLSQVIRVSGSGSSWSQALLAKRPSRTDGETRKTSSRALSPAAAGADAPGASVVATVSGRSTRIGSPGGGPAIPTASERTPSWSSRRHGDPGCAGSAPAPSPDGATPQVVCTWVAPCQASSPARLASTSIALRLSNSGAISGWATLGVPSAARASPQASKAWERGRCQTQRREVSSRRSERWIVLGTVSKASAKPTVPGAS